MSKEENQYKKESEEEIPTKGQAYKQLLTYTTIGTLHREAEERKIWGGEQDEMSSME